jgi:hypothetical protein
LAKIIDVVIILLPRRHLFERKIAWFDRVEKQVNDYLESLPHDYKVPVTVSNVTFGFNEFGYPRTVIFLIIEKETKTE